MALDVFYLEESIVPDLWPFVDASCVYPMSLSQSDISRERLEWPAWSIQSGLLKNWHSGTSRRASPTTSDMPLE